MLEELKNKANELIERHENEIMDVGRYETQSHNEVQEKIIIRTKYYNIYIDEKSIRVWVRCENKVIKCETLKDAENIVFSRDITYKTEVMEMIDRHAHEIVRYESKPLDDYGEYFYKFTIETNDDIVVILCSEYGVIANVYSKVEEKLKKMCKIESIEKYVFNKEQRKKGIACDRILNCNSDWLKKELWKTLPVLLKQGKAQVTKEVDCLNIETVPIVLTQFKNNRCCVILSI